mgnify:CR=1 FL=1
MTCESDSANRHRKGDGCMESQAIKLPQAPKKTVGQRIQKHIARNWQYYLLCLPALLYVFIFCYGPMYGIQIAFRDYKVKDGISGSEWVGLDWFIRFFQSPNCWNLIKNTIGISVYQLVAGFPLPIILALLINQCPGVKFKKVVQTVTYAPHFISVVVLVGMLQLFLSPTSGIINHLLGFLRIDPVFFMGKPEYFKSVYVWSGIWQSTGWGTIIYIAALSGVNPELYEAAQIDGASKGQLVRYIDIPSILPTAVLLFILNMGSFMNVGMQKALLMQNATNMASSEIISTYVYKIGLLKSQFSYSTAIGLFETVINIILLVTANQISKRVGQTSLF